MSTIGKKPRKSTELCCVKFTDSHRRAVHVDPAVKRANLLRLRRIEGQIRGLLRMIDDERYCAEVIVQISAVQEALRGVSKALLQNHLRFCVSEAIQKGGAEAEKIYSELVEVVYRGAKN